MDLNLFSNVKVKSCQSSLRMFFFQRKKELNASFSKVVHEMKEDLNSLFCALNEPHFKPCSHVTFAFG